MKIYSIRILGFKCPCKNISTLFEQLSQSEINFFIIYLLDMIYIAFENLFRVKNAKRNDIDETRGEKNAIFLSRQPFFTRIVMRNPRNHRHKFSWCGFRCAQWNLLMQIRRSHNVRMRMTLIDDSREQFVSFSLTRRCYHLTAIGLPR